MNQTRPCGCKGCRTCLQCEKEFGIKIKNFFEEYKKLESRVFCPSCNKIFKSWNCDEILNEHPNHTTEGISFPGVYVLPDFITNEEGEKLAKNLDEIPWDGSQSGRRKQNFGPKTNFKKMKLKNGEFKGFPKFSKFVQEKFQTINLLKDFQTIEQCTLEYNPQNGASIDPHIDDCWIWGERVVAVNCLGDSTLTLTRYKGEESKYNIKCVNEYRNQLICDLETEENLVKFNDMVIRIPMPNLSLIVLYGPPRYQFEHCVLREDITERRVCIAYREFTPSYLENGEHNEAGNIVSKNAQLFWDHAITNSIKNYF